MSYSGDAAEQVVRMSLEGAEVVVKLAGQGAERLAVLLYAMMKDQKKTKGKMRLTNMLKSGKELKVFAVQDGDLVKFCAEAKKYGVLYTVLKDRDANDGITDIMVRAEDASKVNRIFERFNFATVDMASLHTDIDKAKEAREEKKPDKSEKDKTDEFLDELLKEKPEKAGENRNPTKGPTAESRQSGPFSGTREMNRKQAGGIERTMTKPSVKKELQKIREEQKKQVQKAPVKTQEHIAPKKKRNRKRGVR